MSETRIPTQKRSIEKRERIIEKGFYLMCENGYYNTTTTDIANYADVSVGIIYQYFTDKKDIFMEGIKNYSNKIMYPLIDVFENERIDVNNLDKLFKDVIEKFIKVHTISKKAHEELMAMSHLDEDTSNLFKESEIETTTKIVNILEKNNFHIENSQEKIHILIGIIDNFCHEIVYHKHKNINYQIMQNEVIKIATNLILS
jgi:AcrR family transcriptional regulator